MHRLLVIAGYLTGAIASSAGLDEPAPVSSVHEALPREFVFTPPAAASAGPGPVVSTTGPVVEMTPFRVEEMRPRHASELERRWEQRERLRPKALVVKSIGPTQLLALEPPYLYEAPTPPSSNEVGGVMLTVPLGSLRF